LILSGALYLKKKYWINNKSFKCKLKIKYKSF
jgi:hypothetical protein